MCFRQLSLSDLQTQMGGGFRLLNQYTVFVYSKLQNKLSTVRWEPYLIDMLFVPEFRRAYFTVQNS